ncbi:MAG: hypothetical protein ACLGIG_06275 [Actinomycetes bacterium]
MPAQVPARLGWHPVDPVSLVAGLLAVGVALVSLLDVDVDAGIVFPALLLGAGVIGLVAALRRSG